MTTRGLGEPAVKTHYFLEREKADSQIDAMRNQSGTNCYVRETRLQSCTPP